MSSAIKKYKLFGFVIWSVEVESSDPDEVEEAEEIEASDTYQLGASTERATGEVPMFGFVDWKNYPFGDEEE